MKTISKSTHPFLTEKAILFPVLLLSGIGIIMVYSASSAISMEAHNTVYYFMKKQSIYLAISLVVMFVTASLPYQTYKHFAYVILLAAITLLIMVLIPGLKLTAGGATRWIGLFGFSFQPTEFAKLAMIIFMAYSLSKKQDMLKDFSVGFVPHIIIYGMFAGLIIIQRDLGSIVVLGAITWGMMFAAGVKIRHLISPMPFIIPLVYYLIVSEKYRVDRIMTFLKPWEDPFKSGWQITHSLKAFGSGGIFGKGIGLGMQKLHYLPAPHTDFIFSIIGEELGLIGVLTILILYLILLLTGMRIAKHSQNFFASMAAAGITIYIGVQVFINTGVALGLLPTKGLTLPFISYGGTSLIINMAAMGILMNIGASRYDEQQA